MFASLPWRQTPKEAIELSKRQELTGRVFGRLTVLHRVENRYGKTHWLCRCECGTTKVIQGQHLKDGHTASCGCASPFGTTHAGTQEQLYSVWSAMRRRCYKPNFISYANYGGRGITVCDAWRNDYAVFRSWALANGYGPNLEIDRIDVNGNYEPSNCRWVTKQVQGNNKRSNRVLELNGERRTMRQWAEHIGIDYQTLASRLNKLGWSVEKALITPARKKMS